MKLFKHKKNDRKESIKTKAEQATVVLLTKIFQKFGVNNACERLLAWADIHRKAMFGITISFLSFVTILSLVMRPERKPMQVFNEEKSPFSEVPFPVLVRRDVGDGGITAHHDAAVEVFGNIQRATLVARQILADTGFHQYILRE